MLAANAVESCSFSNRQVFGNGRIAQLVEQLTLNQRVLGSSPSASTKLLNDLGANIHPFLAAVEGHVIAT